MPTLDFTDVLVSPEFTSKFSAIRRTDVVDQATGRSAVTETRVDNLLGVVVYGDGSNNRRDDAQATDRRITVITRFRLRAASEGVQPDVVLYDGVRFTVTSLEPWHRFGSGFVKANAESMNASDPVIR